MQGGLDEGLAVPKRAEMHSGTRHCLLCSGAAIPPRCHVSRLKAVRNMCLAAGWCMLLRRRCPRFAALPSRSRRRLFWNRRRAATAIGGIVPRSWSPGLWRAVRLCACLCAKHGQRQGRYMLHRLPLLGSQIWLWPGHRACRIGSAVCRCRIWPQCTLRAHGFGPSRWPADIVRVCRQNGADAGCCVAVSFTCNATD